MNFAVSRDNTSLKNTDIASQGAAVTVRVRCVRRPVVPQGVNRAQRIVPHAYGEPALRHNEDCA